MGQYVILITVDSDSVSGLENEESAYCALVTSHNPATGLQYLQNYSLPTLSLAHAIQARTRADDLLRTLQIKYNPYRVRANSIWYYLSRAEIDFIKTINTSNLLRVNGLIQRQLAPPPQVNNKPIGHAIADLQARCQSMLEKLNTL